jgi:3-methyladenine DNA glycosylase AlkD
MTTAKEVLDTLQSLGTEQNRKIYARHGSGPNAYGVSFAELEKLRKQIKQDHALATQLWQTGNYDACNLATLIADPSAMTAADLEAWAKQIQSHGVGSLFARNIASKTEFAARKTDLWTKSKSEIIGETGYAVLASLALNGKDLPDAYFEEWLKKIEAEIHDAPNRVRHGMNNALIAIGIRNPRLEALALAAAARIGKVTVNHGDTGCKTPDAAAYIRKTGKRKNGA